MRANIDDNDTISSVNPLICDSMNNWMHLADRNQAKPPIAKSNRAIYFFLQENVCQDFFENSTVNNSLKCTQKSACITDFMSKLNLATPDVASFFSA